MALSSEVLASIIKVAGDWALGMARAPEDTGEIPQPSQMSDELEKDFNWAFNYLSSYVENYLLTTR
jgi:hypothetical protein